MKKLAGTSPLCVLLLGLVAGSFAASCNRFCPTIYRPVCGYNLEARTMQTYRNTCELAKATCNSGGRVVYIYQGSCNYLTDR